MPLVFVTNHVNNPCFHRICHFVDAKISYIVSLILLATKYKNISLVITYFGKFTVISSDVTFPWQQGYPIGSPPDRSKLRLLKTRKQESHSRQLVLIIMLIFINRLDVLFTFLEGNENLKIYFEIIIFTYINNDIYIINFISIWFEGNILKISTPIVF